jgi:hypothetical protein
MKSSGPLETGEAAISKCPDFHLYEGPPPLNVAGWLEP